MIFNRPRSEPDASDRAFADDPEAARSDWTFFEASTDRRHRIRAPFPGEIAAFDRWGVMPGTVDIVAVRYHGLVLVKVSTRALEGVPLDDEMVARTIFEHGLRALLGCGTDPRLS